MKSNPINNQSEQITALEIIEKSNFLTEEVCKAIEIGNLDQAKQLIANDFFDPNFKKATGRTPLSYALQYKHFEIARLIIEDGGDPADLDNRNYITENERNNFLKAHPDIYQQLLISHLLNASTEENAKSQEKLRAEKFHELWTCRELTIPVNLDYYSKNPKSLHVGLSLGWALITKKLFALFIIIKLKHPQQFDLDFIPANVKPNYSNTLLHLAAKSFFEAKRLNLSNKIHFSVAQLLAIESQEALLIELAKEKKFNINWKEELTCKKVGIFKFDKTINLLFLAAFFRNFKFIEALLAAHPNVPIPDPFKSIGSVIQGVPTCYNSLFSMTLNSDLPEIKKIEMLRDILLKRQCQFDINKRTDEGSLVEQVVEFVSKNRNNALLIDFFYEVIDASQQKPILDAAPLHHGIIDATLSTASQLVAFEILPTGLLLAKIEQFKILENLLKRCDYKININITQDNQPTLAWRLAFHQQWELFDKILQANPETILNLDSQDKNGVSLKDLLIKANRKELVNTHEKRLEAQKEEEIKKKRDEFLAVNPHLKSEETPVEKPIDETLPAEVKKAIKLEREQAKKQQSLQQAFDKLLENKNIQICVNRGEKEGFFSIDLIGPEENMVPLAAIIAKSTTLKKHGPDRLPKPEKGEDIHAKNRRVVITEAKDSVILSAIKSDKVVNAVNTKLKNYAAPKIAADAKPNPEAKQTVNPSQDEKVDNNQANNSTTSQLPATDTKPVIKNESKPVTETTQAVKPVKTKPQPKIKTKTISLFNNSLTQTTQDEKPQEKQNKASKKKKKPVSTPQTKVDAPQEKQKETVNTTTTTASLNLNFSKEPEHTYIKEKETRQEKPDAEEKKISKKLSSARKNSLAYHLQQLTKIDAPNKSEEENHAVMHFAFMFNCFRILALLEDSCQDKKNRSQYEVIINSWRDVIRHAYTDLKWEDFYGRMQGFVSCMQKTVNGFKQKNLLGGEFHFKSVMAELEIALNPFQEDIKNKTLGGSQEEKLLLKESFAVQLEEFQTHAGNDTKGIYRDASLMLASILADEAHSIYSPLYIPLGHDGFDDIPELFIDEIYRKFLEIYHKQLVKLTNSQKI